MDKRNSRPVWATKANSFHIALSLKICMAQISALLFIYYLSDISKENIVLAIEMEKQ